MSTLDTSQHKRFLLARSLQLTILASLLMLTISGCGGGTRSTSSPVTTPPNQPNTPPVPQGWVNVAQQYFSFDRPASWKLSEGSSATQSIAVAVEPGLLHKVAVQFELGFVNHPGILNQCAGVDKYLTDFYAANFAPLATSTAQYPYTTTTYDGPQDGPQGRAIRVTITTTQSDGSFVTTEYWLEAVQRTDGIYLVIYQDPSDPYSTWLSFRNTFIGTIVFKSKPISSSYCNYWG